jgi:hypothetical protein
VALVAMCSRCAFDHHTARRKHKLELAYKMTRKELHQLVRDQLRGLRDKKERNGTLEMAEQVLS